MASVVKPDVVDSTKQCAAGKSRATTGYTMAIAVLHGDMIISANHLEFLVVVAVAICGTVEVVIDGVAGKS